MTLFQDHGPPLDPYADIELAIADEQHARRQCPLCAAGSLGIDPDGERVYCTCQAGRDAERDEEAQQEELWKSELALIAGVK